MYNNYNVCQLVSILTLKLIAHSSQLQIMIPGQERYPFGWDLQYRGVIVGQAGSSSSQRSVNHICMEGDDGPRVMPGLTTARAITLRPVQFTSCPDRNLPCSGYRSSQMLPCAVCTI